MLVIIACGLRAQAESVLFSSNAIRGEKGGTVTLEVSMQNDFQARDFQCFINLPAGITPVMNSKNRPDVSWAGREGDHTLSTNMVGNQCRVIGFSATGSYISGNSGVLFSVPLQLNVAPGEYTLTMTQVYVSNNEGMDVEAPEITSNIKVIVYPAGVTLNKTSTEILIGSSETLTAKLTPDDVSETELTWTSSNSAVATVANGEISAVGLGEADITVTTVNGKSAVCRVKVNPILATSVTLSREKAELLVDETMTLTAVVGPENTTDKTLTWSSSNPEVASVENGKVTALKVGVATITATTVNGISGRCELKVNPVLASSIEIEGGDKEIFIGAAATLNVIFDPANTTDKTLVWASSDERVVTLDNGRIYGAGLGEAVVTATATNGVSASIKVKVNEIKVTGISLDTSSLILKEGETGILTAIISPANATFKEVTWSSSDESVATVADGKVTALGRGTVTVTATTPNNLTATCEVKVVMTGDSNDNGTISISDATMAVNDLLNRENPAGYVAHAADVNGDGEISVVDVCSIVNMILNPEAPQLRSEAPRTAVSAELITDEEVSNSIALRMTNQSSFVALQLDIEMPSDLEVVSIDMTGNHTLAYNKLDDTTVRMVVYSLNNDLFSEGELARILFHSENDSNSTVRIKNMLVVDTGMTEHVVPEASYLINGTLSGMPDITVDDNDETVYYDLNGHKINADTLSRGIYVKVSGGKAEKTVIR